MRRNCAKTKLTFLHKFVIVLGPVWIAIGLFLLWMDWQFGLESLTSVGRVERVEHCDLADFGAACFAKITYRTEGKEKKTIRVWSMSRLKVGDYVMVGYLPSADLNARLLAPLDFYAGGVSTVFLGIVMCVPWLMWLRKRRSWPAVFRSRKDNYHAAFPEIWNNSQWPDTQEKGNPMVLGKLDLASNLSSTNIAAPELNEVLLSDERFAERGDSPLSIIPEPEPVRFIDETGALHDYASPPALPRDLRKCFESLQKYQLGKGLP